VVHVESFDSTEEMVEALRERAAHALAGLAPQQQTLTWGDHWVQFHDIENGGLVWGQVMTREDIARGELASDATWDEVVRAVDKITDGLTSGYMYGRAHDRHNVEGDLGTTHKAHVWPIEERLFEAAREVDFDHRKIEDLAMRLLLDVAFRSMRVHVMGVKR
jgi:hypothetical protein